MVNKYFRYGSFLFANFIHSQVYNTIYVRDLRYIPSAVHYNLYNHTFSTVVVVQFAASSPRLFSRLHRLLNRALNSLSTSTNKRVTFTQLIAGIPFHCSTIHKGGVAAASFDIPSCCLSRATHQTNLQVTQSVVKQAGFSYTHTEYNIDGVGPESCRYISRP
jgi:hypothetical protein